MKIPLFVSLCCAPGDVKEETPCKNSSLKLVCLTGIFGIIICAFIQFSSKGYSSLHLIYSTAFSETSDIVAIEIFPDFSGFPSSVPKSEMPVKISEISEFNVP